MAAKILLIDDDKRIIGLLTEFLSGLGYDVASANDGYSAVPAFQKAQPDLVILDYRMPAGDGSVVLSKLRALQTGGSVPVIVLTGEPRAKVASAVKESPILRVLEKPPSLVEISRLVAQLLGPKAAGPAPAPRGDDEPPPSSGIVLDLDA